MAGSNEYAGAAASFACAAFTIAAMAVGIGIMQAMGVASGMEVASASVEQLRAARPLLIMAELLKIGTGLALIIAVVASARRWSAPPLAKGAGYLAAFLLIAAGVVGLFAILDFRASSPRLGMIVGLLGLLSLPAQGVWAATTAARKQSGAPPALKWLGILLAVAGFATLVFPPVGLVFGLVSLGWWIALGMGLRRPA